MERLINEWKQGKESILLGYRLGTFFKVFGGSPRTLVKEEWWLPCLDRQDGVTQVKK